MPPIQSHQDLLAHLAGNGDPSAFYTLAAPPTRTIYVGLRNQGKTHGETMTILVPFLKKIYKNYLNNSFDVPFDVWYESQRKKHLANVADSRNGETVLEKIPPMDLSHFESQMRLVFQRNYSKLTLAKKGSAVRRWLFSPFFLKSALITLGILAMVIGLQIYLTNAGITISFSVSSARYTRTVSLPSAINKRFGFIKGFQTPMAATVPAAPEANISPSKNKFNLDSLSSKIPERKPVSSPPPVKPAPSPARPGITPAAAALATKPLPDTEAVKPYQPSTIPAQYPSSAPVKTEKSSSFTEKTAALPASQKKQPASLPDSGVYVP
jgi:hypothetical protein